MAGRVSFDPTETDWVAANRLWLAHAKWRRWMRWFIIAVAVLAFSNIALMLIAGERSFGAALLDSGTMVVVAAALVGSYWLTPALIPRNVRRMFRQRRTIRSPTDCEWDEDSITVSNTDGNTRVRWTNLHRWLRDERVFAFLLTDNMMLMIPIRALGPAQLDDLDRTAHRHGPRPG